MKLRWLVTGTLLLSGFLFWDSPRATSQAPAKTWGERLGWPAGKRVVIFHADDVGMCYEANQAAQQRADQGRIPLGGGDGAVPLVQRNGGVVRRPPGI